MSEELLKKLKTFIAIFIAAIIGIFIIKKTFFILFPTFLGFLFSEAVSKSLKKLSPISPKVKKTLIILMLMIFFALILLIMILVFDKIIGIISSFGKSLSENTDAVENFFDETVRFCEEKLEKILHRDMHSVVSDYILSIISGLIDKAVQGIPSIIKMLADFIPKAFISLVIFIFSAYYFSCDRNLFPIPVKCENLFKKISKYKESFIKSAKKTVSAYGILFLMTFAELFLGFVILRVNNPFTLSFFVSFIDLLPILGVGTVLIPWAFFCFVFSNISMGIALIVLWLTVFAVRQLAEPKILGSKLGIHPVISLISAIAGLYFFGIFGMLLLPLTISVLFKIIKEEA